MICEDTFIFETKDETIKAHKEFESEERSVPKEDQLQGWWYDKSEWSDAHKIYIRDLYRDNEENAPGVHWIEKGKLVELPTINYKEINELPEDPIRNDVIVGLLLYDDNGWKDPNFHHEGYYNITTDEWFLFTGGPFMETYRKLNKDDIICWYYLDEIYK